MTEIGKLDQKKQTAQPAQALVEMAIVLPILLLLILGAMDFGRVFYAKIVITNAAREGVNYLSRNPDDKASGYASMINAIQNEATSSGINAAMLTISTPVNCCTPGDKVGVTVTIANIKVLRVVLLNFYQLFVPNGSTISISSTVWMVVQ